MEISDLHIIRTVAQYENMTRAAAVLGYVQSHISSRVQLVERELDVKLFERLHHGIQLTPAGEIFLQQATRVLLDWDALPQVIGARLTLNGPLRIGAGESMAAVRLPAILKQFHERYPTVQLSVRIANTTQLIREIQNHSIDIALVNDSGFCDKEDFETQIVVIEQLVLVITSQKSPKQILHEDGLVVVGFPAGCVYRQHMEEWLRRQGVFQWQSWELGSLEAILQIVSDGVGMTMLPQNAVTTLARDKTVVCHSITQNLAGVTTYAVWFKRSVVLETIKAFLGLLSTIEHP